MLAGRLQLLGEHEDEGLGLGLGPGPELGMRRAQQLQPALEHGALGVGLGLGLELWLGVPSSCSRPLTVASYYSLLLLTTYYLLLTQQLQPAGEHGAVESQRVPHAVARWRGLTYDTDGGRGR